MQRKGNIIARQSQVENLVTVGVDMGGSLWATSVRFWSDGKESYYGMRDKPELSKEEQLFEKVRALVIAGHTVEVFYEAGRYGYWPARMMMQFGAKVHILPMNKLKILYSGKIIKTDKLDAKFLSGLHPDDQTPEVYIPSEEEEASRDAIRELQRIKANIARCNDQIIAIIERTPMENSDHHRGSKYWIDYLKEKAKNKDLKAVHPMLIKRIQNIVEELNLAERHLESWEKMLEDKMEKEREKAKREKTNITADKLKKFKGIGEITSRLLSWEIGDFSRFDSPKKFTSYFGLTPCPYSSGKMSREQGISKTGRKSLRKTAVELAWLWVRWQPDSYLTKKWKPILDQKGRARKTAIVALARQLMETLWRHVVNDTPVAGAITNDMEN